MKVTVEGVKMNVDRISPVMDQILTAQNKNGEKFDAMKTTLNTIYHLLQDGLSQCIFSSTVANEVRSTHLSPPCSGSWLEESS